MAIRSIALAGTLLLLITAGGCVHAPYVAGFQYSPRPELVSVNANTAAAGAKPVLWVMASVVGLHRGDRDKGIPLSIDVRMRLENNGPPTITFDPQTMRLISGSLQPFDGPMPHPPRLIKLGPGQVDTITVSFPLPPGMNPDSMGLEALRLQWEVLVDNDPIPQTAYFERRGQGNADMY